MSLFAPAAAGVPKPVAMIKLLAFVLVGVGVLSQILSFVGGNGSVGGLVVAVLSWALTLYFATQVELRKNWARLTVGILAILGAVVSVLGILGVVTLIGLSAQLAAQGLAISPALLGISAVAMAVVIVIDVLVAINAFKAETAAWCAPTAAPTGYQM